MSLKVYIKNLLFFCGAFELLKLTSAVTCGNIAVGQGNIKGGSYSVRGLFPWAVALLNADEIPFCGGTLLTNNFVLTAAHCVHGKNDDYKFLPQNITIALGAHNLSDPNEDERIFVKVSKIEIHENWNITSYRYDADLAMLTLAQNVKFGKYIQPICLMNPNSKLTEISNGFAVGFGKSEQKDVENVLKYIYIPIERSNRECLLSNEFVYQLSSNRTFCAGTRNGSGVCLGDSGNGLFVRNRSVYYLRGIVSASLSDPLHGCDTYNYAVFTDVNEFYNWILDKIKNSFLLELTGKSSIKQDEMHKIILTAENVGPIELIGTVYITTENGNLHVGNEVNYDNKKCINQNKELRLEFPLTPQQNSMSSEFYISANNMKQIKLKATFEGQINAETFKLIDVQDSLELKTNVIDTKLIESNQFDLVGLPGNTSSVATFVGIHGNLLGPALEGLDEIYGQIMYLDEEKILKFATDVIICKYFDYIRDSYHPKAIVARQRISESGPKVEDILKNTPDRKKNLGKLAFITGVLIDAIDYYDASKSISEALTFIKGEQYLWRNKGMYDYYPEFDDHKDISPTVRKYIQIASIVTTMSKNPQVKQKYSNQISISLNYLNDRSIEKQDYKGDHLNSMTAYAYALNGNHRNAAAFLSKLKLGYKQPKRYLKHYSMFVQIASYIILTKTLIRQDPKEQVEWLLKYRNADGAYFSPYDTVLALQALLEYTRYRNYPQRKYDLRIDGKDTFINPSESAKFKLSTQNIKLQTFNQDLGYMTLYQEYLDNTDPANTISSIETSVRKGRMANSLDIIVDYAFKTADQELGNSIIVLEVDLPVGYKHYNPKNEVFGYRNDETTIVLHVKGIEKNKKYTKPITVVKDPNVESYYKPLTIKFYDYYRPNIVDTYKYDVKCILN